VAVALEGLQQALNVRASFDPLTSERRFTLAMTDVGEMYFLPVLMDALAQAAPGVTLQVVSVTQSSLKDDMASGRIDLALGLLPQLQAGFFQKALFRQAYVCLMRQGHALSEKNASVSSPLRKHSMCESLLQAQATAEWMMHSRNKA
jgi:DNA-binding transcriptional LysR family regulator